MNELERILALHRWQPTEDEVTALVDKWTKRLRRPCGTFSVKPDQARAFETISRIHACYAPITVGGGKALTALAAHRAAGIPSERTLILVPARLRDEMWAEYAKMSEHFDLGRPCIWSYAKLSARDAHDALDELAPDLIVCDESHALKSTDSNRTRRFLRYVQSRSGNVGLVAMTGTPTTTSLRDYAHLVVAALGSLAPVPHSWSRTEAWSRVLDVQHQAPPASHDWQDWERMAGDAWPKGGRVVERQRAARQAFADRFTTSFGVVASSGSSCDKALTFRIKNGWTSDVVKQAIQRATRDFELPNGDFIQDPLRLSSFKLQLSHGFYYVWDWPDGRVDYEWLRCRSDWFALLRRVRGRGGLDSYAALSDWLMYEDGCTSDEERHVRDAWVDVMGRPKPPTKTIWYDETWRDGVRRLWDQPGDTVLWYRFRAVGDWLRQEGYDVRLGHESFDVADRTGRGKVALSIRGHGTGLNLQPWNHATVLCPSASGAQWEQLLGRLHRGGQERDVVWDIMLSTRAMEAAWKQAIKKSRYIQQTQNAPQKLMNGVTVDLRT